MGPTELVSRSRLIHRAPPSRNLVNKNLQNSHYVPGSVSGSESTAGNKTGVGRTRVKSRRVNQVERNNDKGLSRNRHSIDFSCLPLLFKPMIVI